MLEALAFLTPLGGARRPTPGALRWFPVVGAAMGLALGGAWWLVARAWPPLAAAAIVVVADLALTGLLHLDGLVDSADGLLPHLPRERRLAVMRQPDAGAFGVGTAGAVLILRWAALASIRPAPLLLGGLWCLSRSAMAGCAAGLPYARAEGGIASAFGAHANAGGAPGGPGADRLASVRRIPILYVVAALGAAGLAAAWSVPAGPVAVAAAALAFAAVMWLAMRRIGGFTGDVLGAAGMIAETVGLLTAVARW